MPLSAEELQSILRTPANNTPDLPDVWPSFTTSPDTSKIDMISESLKTNLNTRIQNNEPDKALRQIFGIASGNDLEQDTFVKVCSQKLHFVGYEEEVKGLFRRLDVDRTGKLEFLALYSILNNEPKSRAKTAIGKVREILMKRAGGISSLRTLGIQFKLLDRDNNGTLSKTELDEGLSKFMRGFKLLLSKQEIDSLFKYFDADGSNSITYDEFLRGIRGNMADQRLGFVKQAFSVLDLNGDGKLTLEEIGKRYNVSENPLVKSGKISEADALRNFIAHWHIGAKTHTGQENFLIQIGTFVVGAWCNRRQELGGSSAQKFINFADVVTLEEFIEYYQWVSSSIDSDEYFELMMRNGNSPSISCLTSKIRTPETKFTFGPP